MGSLSVSGFAEGLAGVSAGDEVWLSEFVALEGAYVVVFGDVGPVFGEDFLAVGVDFDLSYACVSGSF